MRRIVLCFLLLLLGFNVYARDDLSINLSCNSKSIILGNTVSCEVNLIDEKVDVTDIVFQLESDLDVTFNNGRYFSLTDDNGFKKVTYERGVINNPILDSINIGTIDIKTYSNTSYGNHDVALKNIKIYNNNETIEIDNTMLTITVLDSSNLSGNCNLNGIIVDGISVKDFSNDKQIYEDIYVNKEFVFIDAIRSHEKSSVTGLGYVRVKEGQTIQQVIHVMAENGTTKDFTLIITNGKDQKGDIVDNVKSENNKLETLELLYDNKQIEIHFDSGKTVYNINLPDNHIDNLTIKASLSDEKAKFVDNYGPRNVNILYGDNKIKIKVEAENGDVKTYYLYINREDTRKGDSSLLSLKVNDKVVLLNDTTDYTVTVAKSIARSNIEVVANDVNAKIEYKDVDLIEGENKVNIVVTAENGQQKVYHLTIIRSDEDEFQSIVIVGYDFDFDKNIYSYDLNVDKNVKELDIRIIPDTIEYEIVGNEDLENDSAIGIQISSDEELLTYNINIHKEDSISFTTILGIIVLGVGVISVIGSFIYMINVKKKSFTN